MAHPCLAATPADDPTRKTENDPLTFLGASITNNVAHAHANEFSPRVHIMFPRLNLFWSLIRY